MLPTVALLLVLAAETPPPARPPTPLEAEMDLMREIEAAEARAAREKAKPVEPAREGVAPPVEPPARPAEPPATVARSEPAAEARPARAADGDHGWEIVVGMPLRWRSAEITPEEGTGVRYRKGGAPYPGLALSGEILPARVVGGLPQELLPFGLALAYEHGFLSTDVAGTSYDSSELRAAVDLFYERRLGTPTRLRGRLGYAVHRFDVDARAPALTSRRQGLRFGLDAGHVFAPWIEGIAAARLLPWFATSGAEEEAHGSASGWGLELAAGAQGPLPIGPAGLGWRATYDFTRFADEFDGEGSMSQGGSGRARYHGLVLSLTWRR